MQQPVGSNQKQSAYEIDLSIQQTFKQESKTQSEELEHFQYILFREMSVAIKIKEIVSNRLGQDHTTAIKTIHNSTPHGTTLYHYRFVQPKIIQPNQIILKQIKINKNNHKHSKEQKIELLKEMAGVCSFYFRNRFSSQ